MDNPNNPYNNIQRQEDNTQFQGGFQQGTDPSLIAHQLDPNPVLIPLWHSWHGDMWNEETNKWISGEPYGLTPALNMKGINTLINKIRIRFNHYTSLTTLDEDTIWKFKEEVEHDVNEQLFYNEDEWEVDRSYKDSIINDAGQAVLFGMNRSYAGMFSKFLSKTFEQKQTFQVEKPQKKRFGILNL